MNRNRYGILALLSLGAVYAWRNRFAIQQFLESKGIDTPFDTSNIVNGIRSGVAKLSGNVEHNVNSVNRDVRKSA